MKKLKAIKIQCPDCNSTGLYCGFCEPKGTAVVCLACNGRGWTVFKYYEFTTRARRRGVQTIHESRGSFIGTGVGATGKPMTYAEFLKRFPE